jgi:chromate transporter
MEVEPSSATAAQVSPPSLLAFLGYFAWLGTAGFGGPIALAGNMQRDLVERHKWISQQDYLEGLALAQLAPGPLAAQLAIYLGWVRARILGATLVGVAFVVPSFVMVIGLAALYVRLGGAWIQGVFYGVGAAVIAIMLRSVIKLGKATLKRDPLLWGLCAVSAILTAWRATEYLSVFVLSGIVAMLVKAPPRRRAVGGAAMLPGLGWLLTGLSGAPASQTTLWRIAGYFAESGAVVFGSGLAIVPFLHGGVVDHFHWLNERQFLDSVAVAMITPGPVVITVAFIGYLVAGPAGGVLAALGVFLPCYVCVVLAAPTYRRWAKNAQIAAFVAGVTSAAVGAIAGATFVLGRRAITDIPTAAIAVVAMALLLVKVRKVPEPLIIVAAGLVGLALHAVH